MLYTLFSNLFVYRNLLFDLSLKYLFLCTDIYHKNMYNNLKISAW